MINYIWEINERFIEIKGFRQGIAEASKLVSEIRVIISQDGLTAKLIWIYTTKSEQGKGYARDILKEMKNNLSTYANSIEKIVFDKVTSLETIKLIKKEFTKAELDFSNLPEFIQEKRLEDFKKNPWIPQFSPAKYWGDNSCTISKNVPYVNLSCAFNKN